MHSIAIYTLEGRLTEQDFDMYRKISKGAGRRPHFTLSAPRISVFTGNYGVGTALDFISFYFHGSMFTDLALRLFLYGWGGGSSSNF